MPPSLRRRADVPPPSQHFVDPVSDSDEPNEEEIVEEDDLVGGDAEDEEEDEEEPLGELISTYMFDLSSSIHLSLFRFLEPAWHYANIRGHRLILSIPSSSYSSLFSTYFTKTGKFSVAQFHSFYFSFIFSSTRPPHQNELV